MPGSLAELRPLITVVSFLGLFALFVAMIPWEFYAESYEGRGIDVPEYFEGIDIQSFAETYNFTISKTTMETFTLGSWNMRFYSVQGITSFYVYTYDNWWIFEWNYRNFDWYDRKGIKQSYTGPIPYHKYQILPWAALNENWQSKTKECKWTIRQGKTQIAVYFGFNTTDYTNPYDALMSDDLRILFAIGFDQVNTSINAWNIIGGLLFFQMPDVHPAINAIIAVPLWICIAYLIYVLILKALPFVSG